MPTPDNCHPGLFPQISVDGKDLKDPKQIANAFNNFFVNAANTVNKNIPLTFKSPNDYLKNTNPQSLFLCPITKLEIEDIIDSLNSSKASGPFSIPIKLLKLLRSIVSDPICLLINDSFLRGQFPDKLKLAKTMPLHKKGSTLNMNNYQPISLLSVLSKIYEKIMYARLYQFLEKSELFYSLQFGFRAKHSTNHALISITETIKESIDNNTLGCGIFLDLRKAFDRVNHKILLEKLQHYGVRRMPFNWFQSYLTNRKQYVEVNGASFDVLDVMCWVPQGSVLGPLLFLIFINDLPAVCKKLKLYLFADDTNIYFESDSLDLMEKTMNEELKKVDKWLTTNWLALNVDKSHFALFHSSSNVPHRKIRIKIRKKKDYR